MKITLFSNFLTVETNDDDATIRAYSPDDVTIRIAGEDDSHPQRITMTTPELVELLRKLVTP